MLLSYRLTAQEKRLIRIAAGLEGQSMQEWIHDAVTEKLVRDGRRSLVLASAIDEAQTTPTKA